MYRPPARAHCTPFAAHLGRPHPPTSCPTRSQFVIQVGGRPRGGDLAARLAEPPPPFARSPETSSTVPRMRLARAPRAQAGRDPRASTAFPIRMPAARPEARARAGSVTALSRDAPSESGHSSGLGGYSARSGFDRHRAVAWPHDLSARRARHPTLDVHSCAETLRSLACEWSTGQAGRAASRTRAPCPHRAPTHGAIRARTIACGTSRKSFGIGRLRRCVEL